MSAAVLLLATLWAQITVEPDEMDASLAGKRIVVRGVYGGQVGSGRAREIKLQKSKARFMPDALPTEGLRGKLNLEITGVVRVDGADVFVDVIDWKVLPSDVEFYSQQAAGIKPSDFAAWYKLAEWADARVARYDPPGLAEKAAIAYRTGLAVERRAAADDPAALRQLEERMRRSNKLVEFDFDDLDHEVLRAEYKQIPQDGASLRSFADKIGSDLVRDEPRRLTPIEKSKAADYDRDPLATFRSAAAPMRRRLARYFAVSVLEDSWRRDVDSGALDPLGASEQATKLAPDYPAFARQWAEKGAERITGRLGALTERQVVEATTRVEKELRDPSIGKKLRFRWLEIREQALAEEEQSARQHAEKRGLAAPAGDAQTRLELARIYREWFPDDPSAKEKGAKLLTEVLAIEPASEAAIDQLRTFGYARAKDGLWKPAGEVAKEAATTTRSTMTLRVGQRAEEVRSSHGEPDARSRVATRRGVEHQWIYRGSGETLILTLEQSREGDLRIRDVRRSR